MKTINTIDLFTGCGGLLEGFETESHYETLACVEWEKAPCDNIANRLRTKWGYEDANRRVIRFDMQRNNELINGFSDPLFGDHEGLDSLIGDKSIDVVIGGPPCQAYSLAGRIRDPNGMRDDYRNYLFESYVKIVQRYTPALFVFENVPGMLSAMPDGTPIVDKIRRAFSDIGYEIIDDIKKTVFDLTEYGVPQNRTRLVILGVRKAEFPKQSGQMLRDFYCDIMPKQHSNKQTVGDAIGDLPGLYPLDKDTVVNGKKHSHGLVRDGEVENHIPRYHNRRDVNLFKMLASDIANRKFEYTSTERLRELYTELTGKKSNVHKYYVLRRGEPSNTIPAHLYKDGLRHIHPDPEQARSITAREAARLQTFPDDYHFIGGMMHQYKMIGDAVPPLFAHKLAIGVKELLVRYKEAGHAVL
jgi:DNA (cytosine-5)-methyltransferase 1